MGITILSLSEWVFYVCPGLASISLYASYQIMPTYAYVWPTWIAHQKEWTELYMDGTSDSIWRSETSSQKIENNYNSLQLENKTRETYKDRQNFW